MGKGHLALSADVVEGHALSVRDGEPVETLQVLLDFSFPQPQPVWSMVRDDRTCSPAICGGPQRFPVPAVNA